MGDQKHPNDDYIDPTSRTAAAPVPQTVFPDELAEARGAAQGGDTGDGGSGGTAPSGGTTERSLDELTNEELKDAAKRLGVKGYSSKNHEELVEAVAAAQREQRTTSP